MVDGGVAENSNAWKEVRLKESTKLCNNYQVVKKMLNPTLLYPCAKISG